MRIKTLDQLRMLYPQPTARVQQKVLPFLEKHSKHFINTSPFVIISTASANGRLDCSPRGGKPGFVKILNNKTLLIPDAKGNNRIDSLNNIIETEQIACLFLIPGVDETLRLNGSALISNKQDDLNHFSNEKNFPKCAIEISIHEVHLHCAKALMRSELWSESSKNQPY